MLDDKHVRVDIEGKPKEGRDSQNDFETTVFIGNLPFIVSEEEVRKHFISQMEIEGNDPILNVRLIRDPQTFVGKGIGYIQFSDKESMRSCIEKCNDSKFMGRNLRVKKAVEPKRLDKKKRGKEGERGRLTVIVTACYGFHQCGPKGSRFHEISVKYVDAAVK